MSLQDGLLYLEATSQKYSKDGSGEEILTIEKNANQTAGSVRIKTEEKGEGGCESAALLHRVAGTDERTRRRKKIKKKRYAADDTYVLA